MAHCCVSIVLVVLKGERLVPLDVDGETRTGKIRRRLQKTHVQEICPPGFSVMSEAETGDLESLHCPHREELSPVRLKGDLTEPAPNK